MPPSAEFTRVLEALHRGDEHAQTALIGLVYPDLYAAARRCMIRERREHTLQPTALVNETYMRLMGKGARDWQHRTHFLAAASIAMRHVLVDHARERRAGKRPEGRQRVDLDVMLASAGVSLEQLLTVEEALSELARYDAVQARVVELKFYGGLTDEECAEVLEVSARTVKRYWRAARAWLHSRLGGESALPDGK